MTFLYNCRHDGDHYRITKFDADWNVESSYVCTFTECECPAGARDTCRHRQMLPRFVAHEHIGDNWLYDFDRNGWVQGALEDTTGSPDTATEQVSSEPFSRRGL
jgi:hypothetical protein